MSKLAVALMLTIKVHAGQKDKIGEPYLLHILRVVKKVSEQAQPVAALHDAIEDSANPISVIRECRQFLDQPEMDALLLLTRSRLSYANYIGNIQGSKNPIAIEVKRADLRDHLNNSAALSASHIERYQRAMKELEGA